MDSAEKKLPVYDVYVPKYDKRYNVTAIDYTNSSVLLCYTDVSTGSVKSVITLPITAVSDWKVIDYLAIN
jgi:hypothetical protein